MATHKPECGKVGATGAHGDLGSNAAQQVTVAVVNKSKKYTNSQVQKVVSALNDSRVAFFPSGITPKGAKVAIVTDGTDLKHIY